MKRDDTTTSNTGDPVATEAAARAQIQTERIDALSSEPSPEDHNQQQQQHHQMQEQPHRHPLHHSSSSQNEILEAARATLKRNHLEAQIARGAVRGEAGGEESSSGSASSKEPTRELASSTEGKRGRQEAMNVVTTTTATNTTSSGDDQDRESGNNSGETPSASSSSGGPSLHHSQQHHSTHHRHRHPSQSSSSDLTGNGNHSSSSSSSHQTQHLHPQQFLNSQHLQEHNAQQQHHQTQAMGSAQSMLNHLPSQATHANVAPVLRQLHSSESGGTSSASGGEGEPIQQQALEPVKPKSGSAHSLLQPHREPGYHTIKRTFHQLSSKKQSRAKAPDRGSADTGTTSSSSNDQERRIKKQKKKSLKLIVPKKSASVDRVDGDLKPAAKKRVHGSGSASKKKKALHAPHGPAAGGTNSSEDDSDHSKDRSAGEGGGSSSGSGTEGGYAGSAEYSGPQSSSPSVSSSESSQHGTKAKRRRGQEDKGNNSSSESSEIADFSSGTASPSISDSYNSDDIENENESDLEQSYLRAKRSAMLEQEDMLQAITKKRRLPQPSTESSSKQKPAPWASRFAKSTGPRLLPDMKMPARRLRAEIPDPTTLLNGKPPITVLGSDIMAHVLTFLEPPEILDVLTCPLSKDWNKNFTSQPELWRVLCLVEPFKAKVNDADDGETGSSSEGEDSFCSMGGESSSLQEQSKNEKRALARYRLLYTSFVRCMRYLAQIKDDAVNGRPPSFIDYGMAGGGIARTQHSSSPKRAPSIVGANKSLQKFLSCARGVMLNQNGAESFSSDSISSSDSEEKAKDGDLTGAIDGSGEVKRKRKKSEKNEKKSSKKLKFGNSMVTQRLLGPSADGQAGNLTLPWSCAIYSIVNWMVAFSDVEGIQTLCLKVLPFLLEDEQQRMTAQRAGLTDVVLRAMVMFPDSIQLHTAAFHTTVLLARPLGGREGMLFHSSMIRATGIFGSEDSSNGKSGIAVMLDSIRRFQENDELQAMACWSLVNVALAPVQKAALVKLGGIQATANAMMRHPYSAEVQFRGLFALINLVIPTVRLSNNETNQSNGQEQEIQEQLDEINSTSEKVILDEVVGGVTELVVLAMKNFCSSEAILNRACLVLHNLSLSQDYHTTLLFTPNCYQMLEWCLANYRTDQVLQQSATGTLHRLQITLSNDRELARRFTESLRAQQQLSLEQAHREAIHLSEQQAALHQNNSTAPGADGPPPPRQA